LVLPPLMVDAERTTTDLVFARWREARDAAVEALRDADPELPLQWVAGPVKRDQRISGRILPGGRPAP
jgi:hypothetical protein